MSEEQIIVLLCILISISVITILLIVINLHSKYKNNKKIIFLSILWMVSIIVFLITTELIMIIG